MTAPYCVCPGVSALQKACQVGRASRGTCVCSGAPRASGKLRSDIAGTTLQGAQAPDLDSLILEAGQFCRPRWSWSQAGSRRCLRKTILQAGCRVRFRGGVRRKVLEAGSAAVTAEARAEPASASERRKDPHRL